MGLLRACLMEVRALRRDWDSEPVVAFPLPVSEACTTMGVAALKRVRDALDAPSSAVPTGEGLEGLEAGFDAAVAGRSRTHIRLIASI